MTTSMYETATRGKSRFLTLEYSLAVLASILAVVLIIEATAACISLWNGTLVSFNLPVSMLFTVTTGYVGAIILGIGAVIFSMIAYLLFGRVTRAIVDRLKFTKRLAYKLVTYGAFGIMALAAALLFIELIGIIVTSLLLIGSESSISSLYIDKFLPVILTFGLVVVIGYMYYKILIGQNSSRLLSQILLIVSTLILLTLIMTVAIRSHDGHSSNDYGRSQRSVQPGEFSTPNLDDWYWSD